MTDLGVLSYFLGLEVIQTDSGLFMRQKKYTSEVLKRFHMWGSNFSETPAEASVKLGLCEEEQSVDGTQFRQIVGCLRYICHTRPEISFSVGVISRFMSNPKQSHLLAAKRVMRYLRGTLDHGILFPHQGSRSKLKLLSYSDSDWCGDIMDRKSTMGYIFLLAGAPVSWCSRKQSVVALSTCEAEYISACFAACQGIWLSSLLEELRAGIGTQIDLLVDNKSAIDLAKNPVSHGRSKHIETKFHYLRQQVEAGKIKLVYCKTDLQLADVLTKALKIEKFKEMRKLIGVTSLADLKT